MEQKELFLQITLGCGRACLGLVLASLGHSLQYLLCFPALPWAGGGPCAGAALQPGLTSGS